MGAISLNDTYIEWRKYDNIRAVELSNKSQYYSDLINIENSLSGRMDGNICNLFIMEAEQLLVNAIELFEQGYFDCAYYSLRSAVDLSTTMVFLADMPDTEREQSINAWKTTADFPMQGQMIKQLSQRGNIFVDMKVKMPDFFVAAKKLSAELNKYVHKQGLDHFYISRNHPINQNQSQNSFIHAFEAYLHQCIGVVAVMRLAIDPFPVLLMDEEILYRCFDSMTEPYSKEFVQEYIGELTINQYKRTNLYTGTFAAFLSEEKKNEATFNVMKYQYIDSRRIEEILEQLHLLSIDDAICVLLVASCAKTVKVYSCNGIMMYFTDRNTNRKAMSWSASEFKNFSKAEDPINQPYGAAFISVFLFNDSHYFVEHNELLTEEENKEITRFIVEFIEKRAKHIPFSNT